MKQEPVDSAITVRGTQRQALEADLLAHVVMLLGREQACSADPALTLNELLPPVDEDVS